MSTQIKERPILFSAPMVRAILEGRKTQTRRIMKPQPQFITGSGSRVYAKSDFKKAWEDIPGTSEGSGYSDCPYGRPGDRLWVRETFYAFGRWETRYNPKKGRDEWHFVDLTPDFGPYRHEENPPLQIESGRGANTGWWKRPSLFMPRAASRLLLEITDVRVERLQDISDEDAKAEGVEKWPDGNYKAYGKHAGKYSKARDSFFSLWKSINGPYSYYENPFVFAITFNRI